MIRKLNAMMADVDAAGCGDRFRVYVLSDTSLPDILFAEAPPRPTGRRANVRRILGIGLGAVVPVADP